MKAVLLVLCILSLAATSCGAQTSAPTPTAIPPTVTPIPTDTPEPTGTPTPTATPTPTSTPTPTATTSPTSAPTYEYPQTPAPGWVKLEGGGMEIWLPESYVGGNPAEDFDLIADALKGLGPEYESMAKAIEQNPDAYAIWAFDSEVGDSPYLTNMVVTTQESAGSIPLKTYMDLVENQFPDEFKVVEKDVLPLADYEAGRMVIDFSVNGIDGSELLYMIRDGKDLYMIVYATGADDFDKRLPSFEKSVRTFTIQP